MARYDVLYDTHNYVVAEAGSTYRFNLPLVRPLQALCIDLELNATGALADQAPEGLITRIVVKADTHVIVDMEGFEAWLLGSMLGYAVAPKDVSVITTPKCTIVIPFGPNYALNLPTYKQVTVEITLAVSAAAVVARVAATTCPTGTIRCYGREQDQAPLLSKDGNRLTRRFLRNQWTTVIGDNVCQLPENEAYNNLLLCSMDSITTTDPVILDQTLTNIGNILGFVDIPGERKRVIDTYYHCLCNMGYFMGGVGQIELPAAIGATLFLRRFIGVAWVELNEEGRPLDLPAMGASKFTLLPNVAVAGVLSAGRDTIVIG